MPIDNWTRIATLIISAMLCTQTFPQTNGGLPAINSYTTPSSSVDKSSGALSAYKSKSQQLYLLGQQISFTNPSGYCTPGESVREKELVAAGKKMLSGSAQLTHVAIRCDELDAFRSGRRDTLDHWMQIQLIGQRGEFKRFETTREVFLAELAKATPKLDVVEIKKKINSQLNDLDMSMSNINVHQIGRDGNAFYMFSRSNVMYGDKSSKTVTGLGGVTLINSLPLGVWIYESDGTAISRNQLHIVLQQSLVSLISEN